MLHAGRIRVWADTRRSITSLHAFPWRRGRRLPYRHSRIRTLAADFECSNTRWP